MDHSYRRPVSQGALKVLNQRANRDLQQKLNMLDKQYRYTHKMLQQRRTMLTHERRKVVMVKLCEPKATVNIAMKEIQEHQDSEKHCGRDVHTCDGGRASQRARGALQSGGSPPPAEPSRSISAPPVATQPRGSVRHKGNIQSNMSLMQMKNMVMIDVISEKELERERQRAQEEIERLKQLQREALHNKVTQFVEKLRDKSNMDIIVEPP